MSDLIQICVSMPTISKAWCRNDNCPFHDTIDTVSDSKFMRFNYIPEIQSKINKVISCQLHHGNCTIQDNDVICQRRMVAGKLQACYELIDYQFSGNCSTVDLIGSHWKFLLMAPHQFAPNRCIFFQNIVCNSFRDTIWSFYKLTLHQTLDCQLWLLEVLQTNETILNHHGLSSVIGIIRL